MTKAIAATVRPGRCRAGTPSASAGGAEPVSVTVRPLSEAPRAAPPVRTPRNRAAQNVDMVPERLAGHRAILTRLAGAAEAGTLSHAVLLTGPESSGKTTTALALAAELLGAVAWPGGLTAHPDAWVEDSDAENV